MSADSTVVWLRHDLRLDDHPALAAAARRGGPVIPVFIWAPKEEGAWAPGAAGRWWLHHSLDALAKALRGCGSRLVLREGRSREALMALLRETGARAVYWTRRYEPAALVRDRAVAAALRKEGAEVVEYDNGALVDPAALLNRQGQPFRVFAPFWRAAARDMPVSAKEEAVRRLPAPRNWPKSIELKILRLEPAVDWAGGLRAAWTPGEAGAWEALAGFIKAILADYAEQRDRPDIQGTSRLSPHLHLGEISPRAVVQAVQEQLAADTASGLIRGADAYVRQIYWREFAYYLLHHFPHTPESPLLSAYERFPWANDPSSLRAWQRGRTGYPIVDAGLRELWVTGWMHNRVRMIAASFLVKDLLLPWQEGAKWFWDTLVDADLANNTLGWQWAAGCGADAAPYFRIFNPVRQGEKFDPKGVYVRRWVPELGRMPVKYVHAPWLAPAGVLAEAGVRLSDTYPAPIIDHAIARSRAMMAYERFRRRGR